MTVSLYPTAETCINIMHLDSAHELRVRSCILKYAKPDTLSKRIQWVIFRIIQAIKSIFGASDWQKMTLNLKSHYILYAIDKGTIKKSPDNLMEKEIKKQAMKLLSTIASEILLFTLLVQEKKPKESEELTKKINVLTLDNTLNEIDSIKWK